MVQRPAAALISRVSFLILRAVHIHTRYADGLGSQLENNVCNNTRLPEPRNRLLLRVRAYQGALKKCIRGTLSHGTAEVAQAEQDVCNINKARNVTRE
jgi:hypothetical protein